MWPSALQPMLQDYSPCSRTTAQAPALLLRLQDYSPGSSTTAQAPGDVLGEEPGKVEERDREEGKRNTPNVLLPSPMMSSRTGCPPSQVRTCFLRGRRKKKTPKQNKTKKHKHLQSIFLAGSRSKSSRYLHKGPAMYENRMTSFPWVMVMRVWCPEAQMRYQGP